MNPSEVRQRILAEHDRLRDRLHAIEGHVERAKDDPSADAAVRRGLGELLVALRAHVESEEAVLVPALAAADAWGPVRAAQIRADHAAQLGVLADWERAAADPDLPVAELATRLHGFADGLRADMAGEEADLLRPDLLRDDVVSVSQSSG